MTREELAAAMAGRLWAWIGWVDKDRDTDRAAEAIRNQADAIFDALPATPAASGDVEAAWEDYRAALRAATSSGYFRSIDTVTNRHRPVIEAAIRAECGGLREAIRHGAAVGVLR